jgi:histidyl-tRNA synthetase
MNKKRIEPRTLKGFRDFFPEDVYKRNYAISIIKAVFERWGFVPIETPAIEYLEVFTGNVGEDEKLFYKFTDEGDRQVALRYDQTVPTCRFIAEHYSKLTFPFKRYQIQTVWRAEKPQKGRFREFLQCDGDIFGLNNSESDAEVVALTIDIFKQLGFKSPKALINDRELYKGIPYKAIVAIDKLEKIGKAGVIRELEKKGYTNNEAKQLFSKVEQQEPNNNLKEIFKYLDNYGFNNYYQFKPTLARSFSYSTGTIWEIEVKEFSAGSLAGCERFDSLVSRFSNKEVPGVGFAIGFDRTIEAMTELNLFPDFVAKTKVLVTVFSKNTVKKSLKIVKQLRDARINSEIFSNPEEKLSNQLKYANKRQIPFVIIIGDEEIKAGKVAVKNMQSGEQTLLSESDLVDFLN